MDLYPFKEELGSIYLCDSLLAGCDNVYLRKLINHHKYTIIVVLFLWKAIHVIHQDGFPRPLGSRKRGV
jgi:hypothetical protein